MSRGTKCVKLIVWGEKQYQEEMKKLYEGLTLLQNRSVGSDEGLKLNICMLAGDYEEYCEEEFHRADAILAYFPRIDRVLDRFLSGHRRYTQKLYIVVGTSYQERDRRRMEEYYRLQEGRWLLMPYDRLYAGITANREDIAGYIQHDRQFGGRGRRSSCAGAMQKLLFDIQKICSLNQETGGSPESGRAS